MSISYFVPGLTAAHARILDAAGCSNYPFQHGSENGLVIVDADLQKAITALRASTGAQSRSNLFDGIIRLELTFVTGSTPPGAAFMGSSSGGSSGALTAVLAQVAKLQDQANLTDAERAERLRLQGVVRTKQGELTDAVNRLQSASAICAQTESRIQAIAAIAGALGSEMAALPANLQEQCGGVTTEMNSLAEKLAGLAASCKEDQAAALALVAEKKAELQAAKDALSADISKPRGSAEDAVNAAEAALAEAEKIAESAAEPVTTGAGVSRSGDVEIL